ncbi:MAG: hypothetical protein IPF52_07960 [Saprospiraceae bacterium]|nr:hypothetical protein [Saprospiraceae bacterium]
MTITQALIGKTIFTSFSKDIKVSRNSGKIHADFAGELINQANIIKEKKESEIEDLIADKKSCLVRNG